MAISQLKAFKITTVSEGTKLGPYLHFYKTTQIFFGEYNFYIVFAEMHSTIYEFCLFSILFHSQFGTLNTFYNTNIEKMTKNHVFGHI